MKVLIFAGVALSALMTSQNSAWAQDDGGSSARNHQVGAFIGRVLPHKMDGAEEVFGLWGMRYSKPFGQGNGFFDGGLLTGNSEGVKWQGVFVTLSMQIPVETLIGHAGIGVDFTRYETDSGTDKAGGGVHFAGGVLNRLGGNVLARFDMKLNSSPGTSLFFGLGIVIELDGGAGAGAAEQ